MSKLYNTYISLQENEKDSKNTLYFFKSGMFFICIDEDAKIASQILNLKLTNLNKDILKCGFPINSLDKYSNLLKISNYSFKIIDTIKSKSLTISNYTIDDNIRTLFSDISKIDTDNLSIKDAYTLLNTIKQEVILIMEGAKNIELKI